MPNITNFAFCNNPDISGDNPSALEFLQTIEVSSDNFSFSILFTITGFTTDKEHHLYVRFLDPRREELIKTEEFILEKENRDDIDEEKVITGISMGVDFTKVPFEGHGMYSLELYFDDEKLSEFYIPVLSRGGSDE